MSLNNLNTYQQPVISMAEMCLKRLEDGEPCCEITIRATDNRSRDWFNLEGKPLNDLEMCKLTGMSRNSLLGLFRRYKGDCEKIIKNHGYGLKNAGGRSCSKYKTRDGKKISKENLAKLIKISRAKIGDAFARAEYDYIEAYKILDKKV